MKFTTYLLVLLIYLMLGCKNNDVSPTKFIRPNKSYDLAIEGGINTFDTLQYIKLSQPAMLPNGKIKPISNAIVSISDGNNEVFFLETNTQGIYSGNIFNNKNYNQAYTLKVSYNNTDYIAVDTLRPVSPVQSNSLPFSATLLKNGNIQLKIPKHIFGTAASFRWLIVYKGLVLWAPSKLNTTFAYTYSHKLGSPNVLYSSIQGIRKPILNPNDIVTVYKFSVSQPYSIYLYNVFQETDFKNIFSSVPGSIYGNVSQNAEGYFYCTDVVVRQYLAKDLVN
jgi:hypothetical protein